MNHRLSLLFGKCSDPQDNVPFAEVLYTNDAYLKSLYNALSDDGIIVLQLGVSPTNSDPDEILSLSRRRAYLVGSMERAGFQSLHVYDEMNCDFEGTDCSYIIFHYCLIS